MIDERGERRWAFAALAAVHGLHFGLLSYFAPASTMFVTRPVANFDYSLHAYQTTRAVETWNGWGELWGYDPLSLAGQPTGAIEDLTSKSLELFVIAAGGLGVHPWLAFNAYILTINALVPALAYASARLFGLGRTAAVVSSLLWVLLWYFDSLLHWCWYVGMISWVGAALFAVLVVALTYRAIESKRLGHYVLLGFATAVLCLTHPFAILAPLVPCVAMYVRDFRSLGARGHAMLWAAAALGASTTLVWIFPALGFREYIGETDAFLRPAPYFLLLDTLDWWKDTLNTGEPVRTLVRTVCFAGAVVAIWQWHRDGDRRALPVGLFVVVSAAVAYLGVYSWTARQTQPYRQLVPAMLMAAVPAAHVLRNAFAKRELVSLSPAVRVVLVLAAVLAVPRLVRTALTYLPEAVPVPVVHETTLSRAVSASSDQVPSRKGYQGPPEDYLVVRRWLFNNHAERGRILVGDWVLEEFLAASTHLPLLGGLYERPIPHADANFFKRDLGPDPKAAIDAYFERYAVGWVITHGDFGVLDENREGLEPAVALGKYRIYRTRREPSFFASGTGAIEAQSVNRIQVASASGPEVVLKFHWMRTLRCRPDCTVDHAPVDGDRVGFIRVVNPPARFEIYNSYEL